MKMENVAIQLPVITIKPGAENKMNKIGKIDRKLEDVDYWRKRSGWFDDDETKLEYNNGVYDTYYNQDGSTNVGSTNLFKGGSFISTFLKITAVVVALALIVLLVRATQRKSSSSKRSSSRRERSDSSRRSRSRSISGRSRSKSRRNGDSYNLMEEEASRKSVRTSRSRSRRRSRSRTSSRSKSKSRSRRHSEDRTDALV